jgi:hypothetical protein
MTDKHTDYITVTSGFRGHFAVLMRWSKEDHFYEPWQTSPFSAKDRDGAILDGKSWALEECIEFKE